MNIDVGITMDGSATDVEKLRTLSEDSRGRFDRGLDAIALMDEVRNGLVPQMNDVISGAFTRVKEPHLVDAGSGENLTVVHYTKVEVVASMLKAHTPQAPSYLRMYDTFHSNDPDEGKYLARRLDEATTNRLEALLGKSAPCAYVASFVSPRCESEVAGASDNLMFWRTYGYEGAGCSLTAKIPGNGLFRVKYGQKEARNGAEQVKNLVDEIEFLKSETLKSLDPVLSISQTDPAIRNAQNYLCESLVSALRGELDFLLYLYKSKGYEYEQEVRAIVPPSSIKGGMSDKITFDFSRSINSGESALRHYYERDDLATNNLLATGSVITLGPAVRYRENAEYVLKRLMTESGLVGPEIRRSEFFYRNV